MAAACKDNSSLGSRGTLRQNWFYIQELEPGVHSISEPFHFECVHSYLAIGSARALLIDTGMGVGDIKAVVDELTDFPLTVINSHAHWDHIGGNHRFKDVADIAIHGAEADDLPRGYPNAKLRRWFTADKLSGPLPDGFDFETFDIAPSHASRMLSGGELFDLGGRALEIIHAPGHSPGGIVLLDRERGALFSTDAAYAAPLYACGVDADLQDYRATMERLAQLAPSLRVVYPSHNDAPISPNLLVSMRDGLESVAGGRTPDVIEDGVARHDFTEFSILADAPPAGKTA